MIEFLAIIDGIFVAGVFIFGFITLVCAIIEGLT